MSKQATRRAAQLWLVTLLAGQACDTQSNEPVKSRVQGVLAASGIHPSAAAAAPQPNGVATPLTRREPLCAGQVRSNTVFAPKRAPEQRYSIGGQPASPEPLHKGRYTWVNFWAAWCAPCKQELPLLLEWQRSLNGKLDVAFISLDDDERQLRQFLDAQPAGGLHQTYWLPDGALRAEWLAALGYRGEPELPLQLLVDPAGKIRCKVQGAVEAEDLARVRELLRE